MSETQALLQHDDSPTALLSKKLRTLMQYNALQQGYLPGTSQVQEHLAAIIQSPVLNTNQRGLSRQTKKVLEDARLFTKAIGTLMKDKNADDIVQEIIWNLRGASAETEIDGDMFAARLDAASAKADAKTAHMKAKAIADVLYSNPQFRALIHDGSILARDVLSDVVEATATAIAPEEADLIELEEEATDVDGRAIKDDVEDTKQQVRDGINQAKSQVKEVYDQATTSAMETVTDMQKQGQKFGQELQEGVSKAANDAKTTANDLAAKGQKKAQEFTESARNAGNAAVAKLEEVTGITQEDIRKQLDEGVSVDELMAKAKATAQDVSANLKSGARRADLTAGKMLSDAQGATNEFMDRNNVKQRANNALEEGQAVAQNATEKARETADQTKKTGNRLAKDAKSNLEEASNTANSKAQDITAASKEAADQATSKGAEAADQAKEQAKNGEQGVQKAAETASSKAKEISKESTASAQTTSTASDHLKQIGIVHTDEPQENQLVAKGIIHPDPKYTFNDDDVVASVSGGAKADPSAIADNGSDLVQQVIARIREQVKDIQGISQKDLEDAAQSLINKTSQGVSELKDSANSGKEEAKKQGGELKQQADAKGNELQKKGSDLAERAQKEGSELADQAATKADHAQAKGSEMLEKTQSKGADIAKDAQKKGNQIADQAGSLKDSAIESGQEALEDSRAKAQELSQQIRNIDAQDLQNAVNDLLKTSRQKLENATGVKAEDAKQSLEWAIKRGEELAEQAMKNGREGMQVVQDKSSEAAKVVKEKSIEAGKVAEDTAVTVGAQAKHALQNAPRDAAGQIHETLDATQEFMDSAVETLKESTADIRQYLAEKFPPKRRAAIQRHFQGLAVSLRDNTDYSNGLDGLISIARKYVDYTLTFTDELPSEASDVVSTNAELDQAVRLTVKLIERFTNGVGFSGVQKSYNKLKKDMQKEKGSEDFLQDCMTYFKKMVQDMKYAASEDAERHGQQLLQRVEEFAEDTGFKQDVTELIRETVRLAEGFASDKILLNVYHRGVVLFKHLTMNEYGNFVFKKRVMKDFFNIIMPSALKLVQYVPISRVEFQNADVDFLIENLVFESSGNHDQSFLPYRLRIDNHNSVEFLNAYKFESDYSNKVTVKVQGLTMAVRDAGFYFRKKTGFWRLKDSGLLDLVMDGKGVDVDIDLQMSTDEEDEDITKDALFIVKDVRVKVHTLDFSTSGTKHGWLVGLLKPFIKGFIKRQVGLAIGAAMKEQLIYYEYQLRMFQHRIKTAYIANNGQASFESFFRAIFTANAGNNSGRKGQFEVSVGKPGPLAGIFTKASLQQELEDSEAVAAEHGRLHSWKNDIFDVGV